MAVLIDENYWWFVKLGVVDLFWLIIHFETKFLFWLVLDCEFGLFKGFIGEIVCLLW